MSTVLALMVMFGVVSAFALIGQGVSDSRATLEMSGQLRQVATMLKNDLGGATAVMSPPRSPESGEGYLEYTEGPIGPVVPVVSVAYNTDVTLPSGANPPDTTAGDMDDMLLFTVRSRTEPFVGRCAGMPGGIAESFDAEVIWFVRGRTLYRRWLLVAPAAPVGGNGAGFYLQNDISVRRVEVSPNNYILMANTLADLTKPENRFAHRPQHTYAGGPASGFPFHPHFYVNYTAATPQLAPSGWSPRSAVPWVGLMLPTLRECSYRLPLDFTQPPTGGWFAGGDLPSPAPAAAGSFDAWRNPHPWQGVEPTTGTWTACLGSRVAEDAILNNVIGFDVKAWDPWAPVLEARDTKGTPNDLSDDTVMALLPGDPRYTYALGRILVAQQPFDENHPNTRYAVISSGAYVDLNYGCPLGAGSAGVSAFSGPGDPRSRTYGTAPGPSGALRSAVYDTWSRHYERELGTGRGINGFDDPVGGVADGVVDDPDEMEFPPPYAAPLRGIQVKIRVFEPDSRQVREVTVIQEFVTK